MFDARTRARGDDYFSAGRVRLASLVGEHLVHGEVRGSEDYSLGLAFRSGIVRGSCSCPFASESWVPCKHLWALLRAVDAERLLPELERAWLVRFELDAALERRPTRDPAREASVAAQALPMTVAPLYAILEPSCSSGAVITLRLVTPDDQGYREVTRRDLKAQRHGVDRELVMHGANSRASAWRLPALLGGPAPWSGQDAGGSLELWHTSQRTLLERLIAEGRLLVPGEPGQLRVVRPLAHDNARLLLRVVLDASDAAYSLKVRLVTPSGEVGIDSVDLALHWGLVLSGEQLLVLKEPTQMTWALRYVQNSAEQLSFAPDELEALLEDYYTEIAPASLELPDGLELSLGRIEPRPFVDVGASDGSSQGLPLRAGLRYGDREVPLHTPAARQRGRWAVDLVHRLRYARDAELEGRCEHILTELGVRPGYPWQRTSADENASFRIGKRRLPELVHALLAQDWIVSVQRKVYRRMTGFSLRGTSGIDWLEIDGSFEFEGGQLPLGELLRRVRQQRHSAGFVEFGEGVVGVAPEALLKKLEPLLRLGQSRRAASEHDRSGVASTGQCIRLSRAHAGAAVALLSAADQGQEDAGFAELRQRLAQGRLPEPANPPRAFSGTLREYQKIGLGWLMWLDQMRFGGCLADDMGLGKTVQVLALLASRSKGAGPSLVVAPRSIVHNWQEEVARFAPRLRPLLHLGPERATTAAELASARLIVTTYATLCRDLALLSEVQFDYVVLDEAQAIKNPRTHTSQAVRRLSSRNRLALTGTPIENHIGELWAILDFLNPGFGVEPYLGSKTLGGAGALEPAEREVIESLIKPFVLRRTKRQVEPDLPERVEQTLIIQLRPAERRRYQELHRQLRREYSRAIAQPDRSHSTPMLLTGLLRLRQAACHQGLLDRSKQETVSSKLEVLLERLSELASEGAKALVFSQFTQHLDIVERHLAGVGVRHVRLDGKTRQRATQVKAFQEDPGVAVFLISLKAGGSGLNLTAAEYVFLLDPWWNPAVEAQAIDRCHRIGQTSSIVAYRLIAAGTVEEKVSELQQRKRALCQSVFENEEAFLGKLTRDDLVQLLE